MPDIPTLSGRSGFAVLKQMLRTRSLLDGLAAMHDHLGSHFRITMPGFSPIILAGPEWNRKMLVSERGHFRWRTESDPVTKLLRHGVLVEDGDRHVRLREIMDPSLQRGRVATQAAAMQHITDRALDSWPDGAELDMLVEMRRLALLVLMGVLFGEDVEDDLPRIWDPILKSIEYISPGAWIVAPGIPRPGYARPLRALDDYLYELIARRRGAGAAGDDLLSVLIRHPELDDDDIRDQLLTMLIAGHDTSTAQLSWVLYLLGSHPDVMRKLTAEIDSALDAAGPAPSAEKLRSLKYLDAVLKETLRLYPPIHVGNRRAAADVDLGGCPIPEDSRVMVSIYLTHRDPEHWPDPDRFNPERFMDAAPGQRPALAYIPFGGGPRSCIGAAFSQVEARVVLARILQRFRLELSDAPVHAHMGATLEPRPGVRMRVFVRGEAA